MGNLTGNLNTQTEKKTSKKHIPIIIVAVSLIVVMIFIGLLAYVVKLNKEQSILIGQNEKNEPKIELKLNTDEKDQDRVIIKVTASVAKATIRKIILPNGNEITEDVYNYEVNENGKYKFKVITSEEIEKETEIEVSNIKEKDNEKPYIPEGFVHVEGDLKTGFVIQDKFENQFVWIPVSNGFLVREKLNDRRYEEPDASTTEFVNSVGIYKGFYIARYEASEAKIEDKEVVSISKAGQIPLVGLTQTEAQKRAQKMATDFGYIGVKTGLASSYALNTVTSLIERKQVPQYSISTNRGNYSGKILKTGETKADIVYNIADLAGNVKEWTTEKFNQELIIQETVKNKYGEEEIKEKIVIDQYAVLRGGSAVSVASPNTITSYKPEVSDLTTGFRTILFK